VFIRGYKRGVTTCAMKEGPKREGMITVQISLISMERKSMRGSQKKEKKR
jgi:hypothetical protein